MAAGMDEMMKNMGKPPPKELYPSLMELPDLSPAKREEIKQMADKLVADGNAQLAIGLKKLSTATREQNFAAMQNATEQVRRGQRMLESGLEGR